MKKILFVSAIIAVCLSFAGCKKVSSASVSGPVATKVEFYIEWSGVSQDIIDNFDIVFSGVDFNEKPFCDTLKNTDGELVFPSGTVEIKDTEDHCPFTYSCSVTSGRGVKEGPYSCESHLFVGARFYDANGNLLTCWEGGTKDTIFDENCSAEIQEANKFYSKVAHVFEQNATTFVFFRNSGNFGFSHTVRSR